MAWLLSFASAAVKVPGLNISGIQAPFSQVVVNSVRADVYCKVCSCCRTVASTNMNDVSSRSHAIFTILFTQVGKTNLCDYMY